MAIYNTETYIELRETVEHIPGGVDQKIRGTHCLELGISEVNHVSNAKGPSARQVIVVEVHKGRERRH